MLVQPLLDCQARSCRRTSAASRIAQSARNDGIASKKSINSFPDVKVSAFMPSRPHQSLYRPADGHVVVDDCDHRFAFGHEDALQAGLPTRRDQLGQANI